MAIINDSIRQKLIYNFMYELKDPTNEGKLLLKLYNSPVQINKRTTLENLGNTEQFSLEIPKDNIYLAISETDTGLSKPNAELIHIAGTNYYVSPNAWDAEASDTFWNTMFVNTTINTQLAEDIQYNILALIYEQGTTSEKTVLMLEKLPSVATIIANSNKTINALVRF